MNADLISAMQLPFPVLALGWILWPLIFQYAWFSFFSTPLRRDSL